MASNGEYRPTEIDPQTGYGLEYIEQVKKEMESPVWKERELWVRAMTKHLHGQSLTTEEHQALDRGAHRLEQAMLRWIERSLRDLWGTSFSYEGHLSIAMDSLLDQTREEFLKRWNALMEFVSSKMQTP